MRITIPINHITILLTILLLLSLPSTSHTREVNSFNLLLPASHHSSKGRARQIVITSGGCYQWQSTASSVIRVEGTHHGLVPSQSMSASANANCHSNGIVSLVYQGEYPSSVFVVARGKGNTDLISIPVRVRNLARISIFTKSRIMDIRQVQNLQLYGFDPDNNTFTSLEGLRFRWTITQLVDGKQSVGSVEKIPLADSSLYLPLDIRKKLEQEEKVESDLLIVRALRVGKVEVRVRCLEPSYQGIQDSIVLYIKEKFRIFPYQPILLLAGSTYQYTLQTLSGQPIPLPSPTYSLQTSNSFFQVDPTLKIKTPRWNDSTELIVSDTRIEPPYVQRVVVQAEKPDYIQIGMPEGVVIGEEMKYEIRFYNNKRLLKGNVDPVMLNVDIIEDNPSQNAFIIDRLSQKIEAYRKGSGTLRVQYNGQVAEKKLYSTTALRLVGTGRKLVFPPGEIYQLYVIGGSGEYKYSYTPKKEEDLLLGVSSNGLITTRKQGIAEIQVVDVKNSKNRLEIKVVIVRMGNIESIEPYKEFNIMQQGSLYIAATPFSRDSSQYTNQYYTQCNDALLRGLSLTPTNSEPSPLQVINTQPINLQTLSQLHTSSSSNRQLEKMLRLRRSSLPTDELLKQYELYLKYDGVTENQLRRILDQFQDYGICVKVLVKPVSPFDGDLLLSRTTKDPHPSDNPTRVMKLRVYDRMANALSLPPGSGSRQKDGDVMVTPLAAVTWRTSGGPYRWNQVDMGDVEVYLNDIKLDGSQVKTREAYLYPTIKCPNTQKLKQTYTLLYKNPTSDKLLRPVHQQVYISITCLFPNTFLLGLPQNRYQKRNQIISIDRQQDPTLRYFLPEMLENSTIYVLPGQCFRISVEPVVIGDDRDHTHYFYNASNVKIQIPDPKYGKIQPTPIQSSPTSRNTRIFLYDTKHRKKSDIQKQDSITIISKQIYDPSTKQSVRYPRQLRHTIQVKTIKPLTLSGIDIQKVIELPSLPNSQVVLKLEGVQENDRFAVKCNDEIVSCSKNGASEIILTPQNIAKTTTGSITIIDQYAVGNPQITLPIKVSVISGLDLWVSRINILQKVQKKQKIPTEQLETSTRVSDGDQFVAIVGMYVTEGLGTRATKEMVKKVNPDMIAVSLDRRGQPIIQISRVFDPVNYLLFIIYKLPKQSHHHTDLDTPISQKLQTTTLQATLKSRPSPSTSTSPLTSNSATLQIFDPITLRGTSGILPLEQLQLDRKKGTVFLRQLDAYAHIMDSCATLVEVRGGPPELKTKIGGNPGEGKYYSVVKVNERRYWVETLKKTDDVKTDQITILGKQKNLLTIHMYIQQGKNKNIQQLGTIRLLILVAPIGQIHISGNPQLLTNKQARYLVSFGFGNTGTNFDDRIIREECSLKYKWSVVHPDPSTPVLEITSDREKLGINVTSSSGSSSVGGNGNRVVGSSHAEINVAVLSNKNREIGKASKKVSVLVEQNVGLLPESNPNYHKNPNININSDQLILIPPRSTLRLGHNIFIQQLSPCDQQNQNLQISGDNLLITGEASQNPWLVRLQNRPGGDKTDQYVMPTYAAILVTEICTAVIHNVDGSVAISPSAPTTSASGLGDRDMLQLVGFHFMDCFGRRFLHYGFKGVEYRVYIADADVASATIYSADEGLISLQGHKVGQTELTLEVLVNGVVKAVDIVPVQVNVFIRPSGPISVHLGDIINFKAPTNVGPERKWSSSDHHILGINSKTGQAVAYTSGQAHIKLGAMSTRVNVIKVIDLIRKEGSIQNGYEYEIVYSGVKAKFGSEEDRALVRSQLEWRCQVLGKESKFLRAVGRKYEQNNKEYVVCSIQKIPQANLIESPIKTLNLLLKAQNKNVGFVFSKEVQQYLDMFVILSDRYINPRDSKHRNSKKPYLIVVQTPERLDIQQSGGRDSWIVANEFNGARQVISIDLSHYRSGNWWVSMHNHRTKQNDSILISSTAPNDHTQNREDTVYDDVSKSGWKWTDILVVFMAVNFLAILGYQIWQNNTGVHSKSY